MRSTKIAPLSLSTSYLTGSASLGISMTTLISSGTLLPVGTWSRPMGWRFLRRGGAASGPAAGVGEGWTGDFTPRGAAMQHPPTSGTPQLGRFHTGAYTYGHVSTSEPVMTAQLDSPQGSTAAQQSSVWNQPQSDQNSLFNPAVEGPR